MLIEEEPKDEPKLGDLNPDALEAVFVDDSDVVEEIDIVVFNNEEGEDPDEIDIAFQANDEGYW
jgi:hypothetical protein